MRKWLECAQIRLRVVKKKKKQQGVVHLIYKNKKSQNYNMLSCEKANNKKVILQARAR